MDPIFFTDPFLFLRIFVYYTQETIITTRKVSVVMLSVFGPELGPEKQALVAQLLLAICIVFEIYGDPYHQKDLHHSILGKLEFLSLFVEFCTMWSGLMIFILGENDSEERRWSVVLTVCVIVANAVLLIVFIVKFIVAKWRERREEKKKRKAELGNKRRGLSLLTFAISNKFKRMRSGHDGNEIELQVVENPMEQTKIEKHLAKKKVIKHKDDGIVVKTNELYESKVVIHVDDKTGARYSVNSETGETKWLPKVYEKKIEIDEVTGKTYFYNPETKTSEWTSESGGDGINNIDICVEDSNTNPLQQRAAAQAAKGSNRRKSLKKIFGQTTAATNATVGKISQHHSRNSTQLPDGWDKHTDDSGRRYYAGAGKQTQWKPPPGSTGGSVDDGINNIDICVEDLKTNPLQQRAAAKAAEKSVATNATVGKISQHHSRNSTQLPDGWDKHTDDSGRRYYAGAGKQTQWKPPPGSTGGSVDDGINNIDICVEDLKTNPLQQRAAAAKAAEKSVATNATPRKFCI